MHTFTNVKVRIFEALFKVVSSATVSSQNSRARAKTVALVFDAVAAAHQSFVTGACGVRSACVRRSKSPDDDSMMMRLSKSQDDDSIPMIDDDCVRRRSSVVF